MGYLERRRKALFSIRLLIVKRLDYDRRSRGHPLAAPVNRDKRISAIVPAFFTLSSLYSRSLSPPHTWFSQAGPGSGLASCLLRALPGSRPLHRRCLLPLASPPLKPTGQVPRASCHSAHTSRYRRAGRVQGRGCLLANAFERLVEGMAWRVIRPSRWRMQRRCRLAKVLANRQSEP